MTEEEDVQVACDMGSLNFGRRVSYTSRDEREVLHRLDDFVRYP